MYCIYNKVYAYTVTERNTVVQYLHYKHIEEVAKN